MDDRDINPFNYHMMVDEVRWAKDLIMLNVMEEIEEEEEDNDGFMEKTTEETNTDND